MGFDGFDGCRWVSIRIDGIKWLKIRETSTFMRLLQNGRFGELFLNALRQYGIICLGIFRKISPNDTGPRALRRYAITHPAKDMPLLPHDKIFLIGRVGGKV